jgi:enoyl-[acyl-carrier protein] reductase II
MISLALGDSGDLVARAHARGIKVMQMVNSVAQAERAVAQGVDIINAQGTEAGGFSGTISTMILVPQVADAVGAVPVVASGGVFDGRGLAAVIALGAQGVALGTRFLASVEAPIARTWKQSIVAARSEQVVRVPGWNEVFPLTSSQGYDVAPNSLQTDFTEECGQVRGLGKDETGQLNGKLMNAVRERRFFDLVPLTGQTAGAIRGIEPAGEIVHRIATEAQAALKQVATRVA